MWLSQSKVLLMSKEQRLTVAPWREKESTILRTENTAWAQLCPDLKPYCASELWRNGDKHFMMANFSTLEIIGRMVIPL